MAAAVLLPTEIEAGIEVFKILEPEIQKGFIALFHLFHHKQKQVAAVQAAIALKPDLSSTSLDAGTTAP